MEVEIDENDLKAAGAELLADGRHGIRVHGWEVHSLKSSILNSPTLKLYFPFFNFIFYYSLTISCTKLPS